jgi:iron complex outermembrane recepter protein
MVAFRVIFGGGKAWNYVLLAALLFPAPTSALAQSTGTELEELTVLGFRAKRKVNSLIDAEQSTKARSSVDGDYIGAQVPGQSVLQNLNLLPGVFFSNNDAYGQSGGTFYIRGFDANRISVTQDGIPVNDSGNYAIYSHQQLDGELIERVSVNAGTTDVDSPTASASGGTVNYRTIKPGRDFGGVLNVSGGGDNYKRVFAKLDTGELGNSGITSFIAMSYTNYEKFKRAGDLDKQQYNIRLRRDFSRGDFVQASAHMNISRNTFYRNPTKAQFQSLGTNFEYTNNWQRAPARPGLADTDNAGSATNLSTPASGGNFYALSQNPSDTSNIRLQSSFHLLDRLRITLDPSFQYTRANGGGDTIFAEADPRLRGNSNASGVDLNNDGDTLDRVRLHTPNNTRTQRPGVNSSLIWDVTDQLRGRISYTYEYARHRQSGEVGYIGATGFPLNVFGGLDGPPVRAADGSILRVRDRLSIATLSQFAGDLRWTGFDNRLMLEIGLRLPRFRRELNQYCWTLDNAPTGGTLSRDQYCTSQPEPAPSTGLRIAPYAAIKTYQADLPSLGARFEVLPKQFLYAHLATSLSAPRTDNLYALSTPRVVPEKTQSIDFGYRYQGDQLIAALGGYFTNFRNRIVTSFDPATGLVIDRNVGTVDLSGAEFELGLRPLTNLSVYLSGNYSSSVAQANIQTGPDRFEPSQAKELVGKPKFQTALRAEYTLDNLRAGVQAKYVAKRWATDINDEYAPGFWTADVDLRIGLQDWMSDMIGTKGSYLQVNVVNMFDRRYLSGVTTSHIRATGPGGSAPAYSIGAPRTIMATLHTAF